MASRFVGCHIFINRAHLVQILMLILDLRRILLNTDRNMRCLYNVFYHCIGFGCLPWNHTYEVSKNIPQFFIMITDTSYFVANITLTLKNVLHILSPQIKNFLSNKSIEICGAEVMILQNHQVPLLNRPLFRPNRLQKKRFAKRGNHRTSISTADKKFFSITQ